MKCVICCSETNTIKEDVYKCKTCGHYYRDYKGDAIKYHMNIYRKNFKLKSEASHIKLTKNIINNIKNYLNPKDICLDIGSGTCVKATEISKCVKKIHCMEVNEELANLAVKKGFRLINSFKDIDIKYDIVFMLDSLEHMPDLYSIKDNLLKIVGKHLIIQLPIDRKMPSPNEALFDGHFHYFSDESLKRLLGSDFNLLLSKRVGCGVFASGKAWITVWKKQ